MKNKAKKIVLFTALLGTLFLVSCENDGVKPDSFSSDPPSNSDPIKPPKP